MDPINTDLIFNFGLRMSLSMLLFLLLYTIKVATSTVDTVTWYKSNSLRLTLLFLTVWTLSATLVVSPEISEMLGGWGFNAERSPAALAFALFGIFIAATAKPAAVPSAPPPVDPVPYGGNYEDLI